MATRTVSVALVADVGSYVSGMARASASTKAFGSQTQTIGQQTSRGFDMAGKGAVLLGGAVLAAGVGLKSAIGAASDLNETLNKSNVIFGDNAGKIEHWAQGSARNFGLSKQAALEAASGFGNMLTQLGYTGDEAVSASTDVVKLAADLGSFNNLETGDVLDRIGAAMRGEYDSLQLLIPNINAARVEHEAMAATGKENAKQLTAQEKAAATLAIVQKDGAAAANDFAETSDGLANSTKIAAAQFDDLKAQIGEQFLPIAQDAMHFLSDTAIPAVGGLATGVADLAKLFSDLPAPVKAAAGAAVLWAVAGDRILSGLRPLGGLLTPLRGSMSAFGEALGYARANGDGLGTVLKSVGSYAGGQTLSAVKSLGRAIGPELAVAAGAFVVTEFISGIQSLTEASDEAKAAAEGLAGALTLTDEAADRRSIRQAMEDTEGLVEQLERAGVASQDAIDGLLGKADAQERVTRALQVYMATQRTAQTGGDAEDVRQAILAYEELATGYGTAASNARYFGGAADEATTAAANAANPSSGVPLLGGAMQATATQTEEAKKATEDWLKTVQGALEGFIDPLDTYKGLLDEKTTADRESAEKQAAATKSSSDSWEDFTTDVKVSLDEYATALEERITNTENWRDNITKVTARGGMEIGQILLEMGEEGTQITADMANATGAEFERMKNDLIRQAALAGDGSRDALDRGMKNAARVGAAGAKDTAYGIAKELGIGLTEVQRLAALYGVDLALGINPVLGALGRSPIDVARLRRKTEFADGGYTGDGGKYEPKGVVHGGEFVFTKEQTSKAGVGALSELAGMLSGYSGGGFVSTADVPRPPSTAPYRSPISTAADAAMGKAYGDTVDWLKANLAPPLAPGVGWSAMWDTLHRQFPWAQLTSSFRPGAITATGNRSYHSMGRAIDVSPSMEIFDWIAKNYAATELIYSPANGRQEWHGQPHMYGEPTRGDHWDHVHWAMANGGVIGEPVMGRGLWSGGSYSFGERGPETVLPGVRSREFSGASRGGGAVTAPNVTVQARVFVGDREITDIARVEAEAVVDGAFTRINRGTAARGSR